MCIDTTTGGGVIPNEYGEWLCTTSPNRSITGRFRQKLEVVSDRDSENQSPPSIDNLHVTHSMETNDGELRVVKMLI
ncbi:hypothetical protein ACOSQ4_016921 [Xanthoceras sorbifolium]